MKQNPRLSVCYLGISNPGFSRNGTFIAALEGAGATVHVCFDQTPGWWRRHVRLWRAHATLRGRYDLMVVGYPGQTLTWFARLLAGRRAPVILDACSSRYEADVLSRRPGKKWTPYGFAMRAIDFFGCRLASAVLVETEAQAEYFAARRLVSPNRVFPVFTGVDERSFRPRPDVAKRSRFTVLFRGRLMAEAGVRHIVSAAKLLEGEDIDFLVLGFGDKLSEIRAQISSLGLKNLRLDETNYPTLEDIASITASCHVSLGQFEAHERLERTIPHKAFEAAAMGIPYVTARARGISEFLRGDEEALLVPPADPGAIAAAIARLRAEPALGTRLATNASRRFEAEASWAALGRRLVSIFSDVRRRRSVGLVKRSVRWLVPASARSLWGRYRATILDLFRPDFCGRAARPYLGFKLIYNLGNRIADRLRYQPVFEPEMCERLVADLRQRPGAFIDVGANIGLVSLYALAARSNQAVFAFEPGDTQRGCLEATVRKNGLSDRLAVLPFALGQENGSREFFVHGSGESGKDGLINTGRGGAVKTAAVEVRRLDSWWHDAGRPEVSVIKIDTEGAELWVLEGARALLAATRPVVYFELEARNLSAYPHNAKEVITFLEGEGYDVESVAGERCTPQNIEGAMGRADTFRAFPRR